MFQEKETGATFYRCPCLSIVIPIPSTTIPLGYSSSQGISSYPISTSSHKMISVSMISPPFIDIICIPFASQNGSSWIKCISKVNMSVKLHQRNTTARPTMPMVHTTPPIISSA